VILKWIIYASPITALSGLTMFGELSGQMSTYLVVLSIPFYAFRTAVYARKYDTSYVSFIAIFTFSLIASFLFSAESILNNIQYGRSGLDKYVTSALVFAFGFFVSHVVISNLRCERDIQTYIVFPLLIACAVNLSALSFEILSANISLITPVYKWVSYNIFHTQHNFIDIPGRLRGLGTEPSHLGTFVGYALPWLMAFRRNSKLISVVAIALVVVSVLSTSRTAYIVIVIDIIAFFLVKMAMRRNYANGIAISFLLCVSIVLGSAIYLNIYSDYVSGLLAASGSVSNITRSATIIGATDMFLHSPIFGVGLGQGGFGIVDRMPSWAYWSYETLAFEYDRTGSTVPIFSLVVRTAAELGIAGLIAWYGGLALLLAKILQMRNRVPLGARDSNVEMATVAVIVSLFALIGVGLSVGSFRSLMLWVDIGCLAFLLKYYRRCQKT